MCVMPRILTRAAPRRNPFWRSFHTVSKIYDAAESYTDIVDASAFNLDEDDKDQAKKIDDAKKTLTDALKEITDKTGTYHDNLEQFNKHLANFQKDLKAAAPSG